MGDGIAIGATRRAADGLMHNTWRFCPRCGAELQQIERAGAIRPVCRACGFVYFADPKVTVSVLMVQDGKILLGKRVMEPQQGKWCLPGGFMDYGEEVRGAAAREVLEETGLTVEIGDLLLLTDWDDTLSNKKGVALCFLGIITNGTPVAADDISELEWFSPSALPDMAFDSDMEVIRLYFRS